jgi:hypothetical protein
MRSDNPLDMLWTVELRDKQTDEAHRLPPWDGNPDSDDTGTLLYLSYPAANAAAKFQTEELGPDSSCVVKAVRVIDSVYYKGRINA